MDNFIRMAGRLLAYPTSLALLLLLCTCGPALGQNPFVEPNGNDLVFDEQADLDAFQNGAKYTSTNVSITLNGNNATDPITSLANLSDLETIGGKLTIVGWGTDEQSRVTGDPLAAFASLTTVNNLEIGDFDVNNLGVTAVTAPLLTEVGVRLQIRNCNNLDSIGMPELRSVTNSFVVDTLRNLRIIDMPKLTTIGNDLQLEELDKVVNLDGFGGLADIGRSLRILRLPLLEDIEGLGANVPGGRPTYDLRNFIIRGNIRLANLDSLRASASVALKIVNCDVLTSVGEDLLLESGARQYFVQFNPQLTSIAAILPGPGTISIEELDISGNAALSDPGFAPLAITESIIIEDNASLLVLPTFDPTVGLTGELRIVGNPEISSLFELRNLVRAASLTIDNNDQLNNLDGLASLTELDNFLIITNNDNLGDCCALPCKTTVNGQDFDGTNDAVTVQNNTGNCADKQAVTSTCGGSCIAAPVELVEFTARRQADGTVGLDWVTLSESDNAYFTIEATGQQDNFVAIGRVAGQGTTTGRSTYHFTDAVGARYYRLRQVDHDGTESFSPVVYVAALAHPERLTCYPNPSSGGAVRIELGEAWRTEGGVQLRLRDAAGRSFLAPYAVSGSTLTLTTADLPHGIYAVSLGDGRRVGVTLLAVR